MTIEEFVDSARGSGTVFSIAHPLVNYLEAPATRRSRPTMPRVIGSLRERGVAGVEAYYGGTNAATRSLMVKLTRDAGMIPTGGSDYHGIYKRTSRSAWASRATCASRRGPRRAEGRSLAREGERLDRARCVVVDAISATARSIHVADRAVRRHPRCRAPRRARRAASARADEASDVARRHHEATRELGEELARDSRRSSICAPTPVDAAISASATARPPPPTSCTAVTSLGAPAQIARSRR